VNVVSEVAATLTPDLLRRHYRPDPANPTAGHCYAATEALWHLLGGKASGYVPHVARDGGDTHWWLRNPTTGEVIDPTACQYRSQGLEPPYAAGRGCGFMTAKPSKRAQEIMRRVKARETC
jgi:hypothetical protein